MKARAAGKTKAPAKAKPASAEPKAKPSQKPAPAPVTLRKQYAKDKSSCKVTFTLPASAAPDAKSVCLCGDFNAWAPEGIQMKKTPGGLYSAVVALVPGRAYRFRFLIDGGRWENHWAADRYERNAYGTEDSVVEV